MKIRLAETRRLVSFILFCILISANQNAFSQFVCQPSGAPIVQNGALIPTDFNQLGKIKLKGRATTCTGTNGITAGIPGSFKRDAYTFTAPVTGCATVDVDANGCAGAPIGVVAYSSYFWWMPKKYVIGDLGVNIGSGTGSFAFPVTAGMNFRIVVHDAIGVPNTVFCSNYTFMVSYSVNCRQVGFDRSNNGTADFTIWRVGAPTLWWTFENGNGPWQNEVFGQPGDFITPGDYDGDGITDVSVYRTTNPKNVWLYGNNHTSPSVNFTTIPFGLPGDIPIPGDYDRDGRSDPAVWRPSSGTCFARNSTTGITTQKQWGLSSDIPVVGDFDGDRIHDCAVFRPSTSTWYILMSNFEGITQVETWGAPGDMLVPADYDGDGRSDIAVWRPVTGTWFIHSSITGLPISPVNWGASGDIPQPADYDGDRRADVAYYSPNPNPNMNFWMVRNSSGIPTTTSREWGIQTDQPATAAYRIP